MCFVFVFIFYLFCVIFYFVRVLQFYPSNFKKLYDSDEEKKRERIGCEGGGGGCCREGMEFLVVGFYLGTESWVLFWVERGSSLRMENNGPTVRNQYLKD